MQRKVIAPSTTSCVLALVAWAGAAPPGGSQELSEGVALYEECALDKAKEVFRSRLDRAPQDAESAFYLARCLAAEKEYDEALSWLEKAVAQDPASSRYHQILGEVLGLKARDLGNPFRKWSLAKQVLAALVTAVELDPDNLDARFVLLEYYAQAPKMVGGGVDKALAQAAEISKRDPSRGHHALGTVHQRSGDPEQAEAEYRTAVGLDPENRNAWYALGLLHLEREEFEAARRSFEALLKLDDRDSAARYQMGVTAARSGRDLARGAAMLRAFLSRDSCHEELTHADAYYFLGQIHEQEGEPDAASAAYRKALDLDPHHKAARRGLKEVSGEGGPR